MRTNSVSVINDYSTKLQTSLKLLYQQGRSCPRANQATAPAGQKLSQHDYTSQPGHTPGAQALESFSLAQRRKVLAYLRGGWQASTQLQATQARLEGYKSRKEPTRRPVLFQSHLHYNHYTPSTNPVISQTHCTCIRGS